MNFRLQCYKSQLRNCNGRKQGYHKEALKKQVKEFLEFIK